jgi:hypothetical protein
VPLLALSHLIEKINLEEVHLKTDGLVNTALNVFPEATPEQVDDIILRASNVPGDITTREIARVADQVKRAHEQGKTLCAHCESFATSNLLCDSCNEVADREASRA